MAVLWITGTIGAVAAAAAEPSVELSGGRIFRRGRRRQRLLVSWFACLQLGLFLVAAVIPVAVTRLYSKRPGRSSLDVSYRFLIERWRGSYSFFLGNRFFRWICLACGNADGVRPPLQSLIVRKKGQHFLSIVSFLRTEKSRHKEITPSASVWTLAAVSPASKAECDTFSFCVCLCVCARSESPVRVFFGPF